MIRILLKLQEDQYLQ